jgi:hypothetical protein
MLTYLVEGHYRAQGKSPMNWAIAKTNILFILTQFAFLKDQKVKSEEKR